MVNANHGCHSHSVVQMNNEPLPSSEIFPKSSLILVSYLNIPLPSTKRLVTQLEFTRTKTIRFQLENRLSNIVAPDSFRISVA